MDQIYFGQRIAALRKECGMSQEALGQKLGVTNQAVSKWESDQCCPDIMQLPALADIFGISLDALFGRTVPEVSSPNENITVEDLPWEDNNDLHAVCFVGHQLMSYQKIPTPGTHSLFGADISSWFAKEPFQEDRVVLSFTGTVHDVYSDFSVTCQDVQGNVHADDSITCGKVLGGAFAGDSITCNTIGTSAQAGADIQCAGIIGGNVQAGGDLTCTQIGGRVQCDGDITCHGDIQSDVKCEGDLTCGEISGNVTVEGDLTCSGDIQGDVRCEGDITCSSIHGNARAEGDIFHASQS